MRTRALMTVLVPLTLLAPLATPAAEPAWKAGVAVVDITPEQPVWLAGYASRIAPSQGVMQPIHVKALALKPETQTPLVVVTTDLITFPRSLARRAAKRLGELHDLPRANLMFGASHSHSSPVIEDRLIGMYKLTDEHREQVRRYTDRVEDAVVAAVGKSLETLRPARLSFTHGEASFGKNRRRVQPDDPQDDDVPVLFVDFEDADGGVSRAVLFAYACHNTTLNGQLVGGDYAGFAQSYIEEDRPDWKALFLMGCGGDVNPTPRRTDDLVRRHGRELADGVLAAADHPRRTRLPARAQAAFDHVALPLVEPPTRKELQKQLEDRNVYVRVRARQLLERLDAGEDLGAPYDLPLQVWRLGDRETDRELVLVAIAGEVVVDYQLRLKRELGAEQLFVAAYTNACPAYIPSERVLKEGGYEGASAMLYYGFHGPWQSGVEERVFEKLHDLLRQVEVTYGDAASGDVFEEGAGLERVWTGGEFTEGPATGAFGEVYFTDIPNLHIRRLGLDGKTTIFKEDSGRANGLIFDRQGRLLACEGAAANGRRRVTRYELDGRVTVLADRFEGKRLNSPNDITIDSLGRIYFSDPRYSGDEPRELDHESVYRIDTDGTLRLAIRDVEKPNGLAVSPDGNTLYVSDTDARKLYAYRIDETDALPVRDRVVFDFTPGRSVDGMEVDVDGNIYAAAGSGERTGIYVISPEGELLDRLPVPEFITNCAFGGADGRTLYITSGSSLYRTRTRRPGFVRFPEFGEE